MSLLEKIEEKFGYNSEVYDEIENIIILLDASKKQTKFLEETKKEIKFNLLFLF